MKELSKDYIEEIWFRNSLSTILSSYRSSGKYNLKYRKNELKKYLFETLNDFPENDDEKIIDKWYEKKIVEISLKFDITIGRTQKLLNILIKYFITSKYYLNSENIISNKLSKNIKYIHVPIDRILLKEVRNKNNYFKKIINSNFQIGLNDNVNSWSKLNDIKVYNLFQKNFREISNDIKKVSPILFEIEIWNKYLKTKNQQ